MKLLYAWASTAFLASSAAAASQQYVNCPGVKPPALEKLCGQLKHPPKARGSQVRCNSSEMNAIASEISVWKNKIERAVNEQRQIVQALNNLSVTYGGFPAKRDYLKGLAGALEASLLGRYLEPLYADLTKSQRCIWDKRYERGGCRYIPRDTCYDRGGLEQRVRTIEPLVDEVMADLRANTPMLVSGLPQNMFQAQACGPELPPCRQNMEAAVAALLQAEEIVKDNLYIPGGR